jgi:hypothetical protein
MAHKLDINVVAEGIETDAQRERLADAGCDFGQGYLFSPPLPEDAFFAYLATEPDDPRRPRAGTPEELRRYDLLLAGFDLLDQAIAVFDATPSWSPGTRPCCACSTSPSRWCGSARPSRSSCASTSSAANTAAAPATRRGRAPGRRAHGRGARLPAPQRRAHPPQRPGAVDPRRADPQPGLRHPVDRHHRAAPLRAAHREPERRAGNPRAPHRRARSRQDPPRQRGRPARPQRAAPAPHPRHHPGDDRLRGCRPALPLRQPGLRRLVRPRPAAHRRPEHPRSVGPDAYAQVSRTWSRPTAANR